MLNKVQLIGNLGQDPEVNPLPGGGSVANISLATTRRWKDKQTGERKDATEWHRIVFFNRLAEVVGEYLKKGSQIYVEGRLQTRKWQDQSGNDRYTTEIVANEMQMLGNRGNQDNQQQASASTSSPSAPSQAPQQGNANTPPPVTDDFDDSNIPF